MKFKKYVAIMAAVVGVMGCVVGGTMAYMTESEDVTNVFTVGDLDVGLTETEWNNTEDGQNLYPGSTVYKNPTVKNITNSKNGEEPCYVRMTVYVQDANGKEITDSEALKLIEKTVRYDPSYTGSYSSTGTATGLVEGKIPGYSLAELDGKYSTVNSDWVKDTARSTASKWVYNYVGKNKGIMQIGEESTLFTNIVIPTDWNQTQLSKIGGGVLGSFKLKVQADAIQASGFASQEAAMNALDAEIAAGTQQTHVTRS